MADIVIRTIPHTEQAYETVGNWWFTEIGTLQIRVSDMGDWKKEALVAFHELAEALLCKARGIDERVVTEFDKAFETKREETLSQMRAKLATFHVSKPHRTAATMNMVALIRRIEELGRAEPGDDPAAPYSAEHKFATSVERLLAAELGVGWAEYDEAVNAL